MMLPSRLGLPLEPEDSQYWEIPADMRTLMPGGGPASRLVASIDKVQ